MLGLLVSVLERALMCLEAASSYHVYLREVYGVIIDTFPLSLIKMEVLMLDKVSDQGYLYLLKLKCATYNLLG